MLHIICTEKQLPAQLDRHRANALLCALRHGRMFERPGTPWRGSAMAPNAPVNLPYSPVVEDLRRVARQIERLRVKEEVDGGLSNQDRGRLSELLVRREGLRQEARDAIEKEPQWPYVAGLYAVRVPALRLTVDGETREEEPCALFRQVTMEDTHPLWAAMSKALTREPRNTLVPAPAFRVQALRGQRLYQRGDRTPAALADWLLGQVAELALSDVRESEGDYQGRKEAPPAEVQAAD